MEFIVRFITYSEGCFSCANTMERPAAVATVRDEGAPSPEGKTFPLCENCARKFAKRIGYENREAKEIPNYTATLEFPPKGE